MEQVRQGRGGQPQQLGGGLLGHDLAVAQHQVLQAIGHPTLGIGPGQALTNPAMCGAVDLARPVHQPDRPRSDRDVAPVAWLGALPDDLSAPAAVRAATAVFKGLDEDIKPPAPAKGQADTAKPFELEQLSDKLVRGHGAYLLCCLFGKQNFTGGPMASQVRRFQP